MRAVSESTVGSNTGERPGYFAFEPFANRARGEFSAANDLMSVAITVGETRSVVTLSSGNELDFVTPRLVTGVWSSATESGTNRFTLLAGDPRATRRLVGVESDAGQTVSGLYALDYFDFDDSFRGQYYDVKTDNVSDLLYKRRGRLAGCDDDRQFDIDEGEMMSSLWSLCGRIRTMENSKG